MEERKIELKKISQRTFEQFFELLNERGVSAQEMTMARYAGEVCRCAADAGWIEMAVDEADPREVIRMHRAIQKRVGEILAPDPN